LIPDGLKVYQFAENIKSNKALFFYRGGMALYALLRAMEIEQGNEVILQVFTCPAVPSPVVRLGATPVYVDIDPRTFSIDPDRIEERITEKTKAIIVQHTYGIPAEMDRILAIAREYDLRIIEDCCHAFGSRYDGQEVGTFGDAAIYSFGWYKPVVLGIGGAAVINNPILKQKVQELYTDFIAPSLKELMVLYIQYSAYALLLKPSLFWLMKDIYHKLSKHGLIAGTTRRRKKSVAQGKKARITQRGKVTGKKMIPFQERRLFQKLDRFVNGTIAHQKWLMSRYEELLSQAGYSSLTLDDRCEPVFYKYPLLLDRKQEILKKAPQARIELSSIFVSPLYPAWREARWRSFGYQKGMCPISEDVSDRIVALPVHDRIQAKDIERTIAFLTSFQ
jgi:perosamine synthetase